MADEALVEIIVEAVDRYTKTLEGADKKVEKVGKTAANANRQIQQALRTAAAIGGGFAAAFSFLDKFGDKAKDLGFTTAARQVEDMRTALADAEAAALKFNIAGKEIQVWLGQAAEGMGTVIRLAGVLASIFVGNVIKAFNSARASLSQLNAIWQIGIIQIDKMLGLIDDKTAADLTAAAAQNTYTSAMADADNAMTELTIQTNVANFATVGLNSTLEKTGRSLTGVAQSTGKALNTLKGLINAQKEKNRLDRDSLALSDAVRAGDARAFVAAQGGGGGGLSATGGGGRATGNIKGTRGGSATAGATATPVIQVFIGNQEINKHIKTQFVKALTSGTTNPIKSGH